MTTQITQAFSDAARYVDRVACESFRQLQDSSSFGVDSAVRDELAAVAEDCREPDWDGYGARPVTQDALRNAYEFLESLYFQPVPGALPPSVGADPDGDLTLEWHRNGRRTLSISISPYGDLNYSALLGPNREFGTEVFYGDVPANIRRLIRRLYAA